jgi:hypothetical protein
VLRDKYRLIAVTALRAVNAMPNQLADKNPTVVEHIAWLTHFDPDRLLSEYFNPMDSSPLDSYDDAEDTAINEFDGEEFIESPEMQDIIGGRDAHNPDENELSKDEIMGALETYLRHYIETFEPEFNDGYTGDSDSLAAEVYEQAVEALHKHGFVVSEAELAEAIGSGDELTIEDVLLPSPNKGVDLRGEVTKADVTDPDNPDHHGKPDTAYTSRLMTLAGLRGGTPY